MGILIKAIMYLDIFILVVLLYAIWKGWTHGLLRELVSTLGFIAGLVIACLCYGTLGEYLAVGGTQVNIITSLIAFFLLWIVAPIALGGVATVITSALNKIGFISLPNRLGGVAVSLVKYAVLLSVVLNVMQGLHILSPERQAGSHLLEPVTSITQRMARAAVSKATTAFQNDTIEKNDTIWVDVSRKPASTPLTNPSAR